MLPTVSLVATPELAGAEIKQGARTGGDVVVALVQGEVVFPPGANEIPTSMPEVTTGFPPTVNLELPLPNLVMPPWLH